MSKRKWYFFEDRNKIEQGIGLANTWAPSVVPVIFVLKLWCCPVGFAAVHSFTKLKKNNLLGLGGSVSWMSDSWFPLQS